MRLIFLTLFLSFSVIGFSQKTWYGEIAVFGGGGTNDIFRFDELDGAASYTGNGYYTFGMRLRRMMGEWFSVESGLSFSGESYTMRTAPVPETTSSDGSFGIITVPVNARADFLRYLFADAGIIAGIQTGSYGDDNLSGMGVSVGLGASYRFKSDIIITARAYASQYSLIHFMPEDYPHSLYNSGFTVGIGYRFIRLGKCNCPEGNAPGRKFF